MELYIKLIPLLPLAGFVLLGLLGKNISKTVAAFIGCGSVGIAFILSSIVFANQIGSEEPLNASLFSWIEAGRFNVGFTFLVDHLSSVFLMVITGVGLLIHIYSAGYMHEDEKHNLFFTYLNLFIFFMLLLVMGDNYLVLFIGWEGVGLCSYLLIGFWHKVPEYNNAAKKAFIMNRIGDLGLLLGMLLLFTQFGSVNYATLKANTANVAPNSYIITLATLLLFVGAIGKSAQIPLFTWLPDAMAGPTPVSALIHAATMVTAGIYMIARSSFLYSLAPFSMEVVAWVGIITSLLAASIGMFQNDIKKVLAYSTVSQLGLMFLGLGVGAYSAGVFHVVTHAFFKALLFLCAGSVIHAMGGEQDIRKMGGLRKKVPITFITFLIGTLAISGIPPFAGFFSKDQILGELVHEHKILALLGMLVSIMTCFYMFRLLFLVFFGSFRGTHEQEHHLHESPLSMTFPLMVLAVLSTIGGFIGIPHGIAHSLGMHHWFDAFLATSVPVKEVNAHAGREVLLIAIATGILLVVILAAYIVYIRNKRVPDTDEQIVASAKSIVYHKYYIDEIYNVLVTRPLNWISGIFSRNLDKQVIDGVVNAFGSTLNWTSGKVRLIQTGYTGFYMFALVLGILALLLIGLLG
jgi:NADH-quinone oxidoreductase subunit L